MALIPFGVSLVALAWPVQRGIPWPQVRRDIGLTLGERPAFEPLAGIACYILALPLVALGVIVMLMLVYFQSSTPADSVTPLNTWNRVTVLA